MEQRKQQNNFFLERAKKATNCFSAWNQPGPLVLAWVCLNSANFEMLEILETKAKNVLKGGYLDFSYLNELRCMHFNKRTIQIINN